MNPEPLHIDVFNGDADGICALHQLRMARPCPSRLVSGVKRDINLLRHLHGVTGAQITVLDISLNSNRQDLVALLEGNSVLYVDHHFAGQIPASAHLEVHIDPSPDVCTSLIVDRLLDGAYRKWAVAAAFGDNLHDAARKAALSLSLDEAAINTLREIGELLNYNGYGRTLDDLFYPPQDVYKAMRPYADPLEFARDSSILQGLRQGFHEDMEKAGCHEPVVDTAGGRVFVFPAEAWPQRVAGVFSNEKAREQPHKAHAVLVDNNDSTYTVSVRAPLAARQGADSLCLAFPTGGGRAGAAGINALPADSYDDFLNSFARVFAKTAVRG